MANISVSKMAKRLNMSRSQFYLHLKNGVFPEPAKLPYNDRPYYDEIQQEACIRVRDTGVGLHGNPIMFYERVANSRTSEIVANAIAITKVDSKAKQRSQRQRLLYGLPPGQYELMLTKQHGRCLICGNKPNEPLLVDHCHMTKNVRGLLCVTCNSGIGMFKENSDLMRKAISYLEESWERKSTKRSTLMK